MTQSFLDLVDLASERLGGAVVAANDEFFAAEGKPDQTRRRRSGSKGSTPSAANGWTAGKRGGGASDGAYDWCVVRLGAPGIVRGVDVDTAHFKGNFPEACAIDVCDLARPAGSRRRS